MATTKLYTLDGKADSDIELPEHFDTPYRPDIIKRAVLAVQSRGRQPHGVDPLAGKRTTAESWGVGHGRSRVPRVKGGGTPAANKAGFMPGVVGGRRAHPPEAREVLEEDINRKENRLAIRSAIAATGHKDAVSRRGHKVDSAPSFPIVVSDELETLTKTREVMDVIEALGLSEDIERVRAGHKIRAGKGKMRGRKYKTPKSILFVVGEDLGIERAARNIPGVEIAEVNALNADLLAPGTHAGRLVIWTKSALERLQEEGLFV
ncbi:MAG: 50S ribosomal protein L4 [Candidatus Thorarchaeota archaeon]|nr:50S ribosomal protein L4 [Candidatus Thorarchaeota archaeon]